MINLFLVTLLGSCDSETQSISEEENKYNICSDIKQIYCEKLYECNDINIDYCNSISGYDRRCEESKSTSKELSICRDMLRVATCLDGVPKYCKNLEDKQ